MISLTDYIQREFIDKGSAGAASLMAHILIIVVILIVVIVGVGLALTPNPDMCVVNGIEQIRSKSRDEYIWVRRDGALVTETYVWEFLAKTPRTTITIEPGDHCAAPR